MDSLTELTELTKFNTADVCDALGKLGVSGYVPEVDLVSSNAKSMTEAQDKIVGLAYTVELVEASDNTAPKLAGDEHWIDQVGNSQVVVISAPQNQPNAVFGGLLCTRAKHLGAIGIVTTGRVRDIPELQELGMPVYCRGRSCMGAGGYTRASRVNCKLELPNAPNMKYPSVSVEPNDIVFGDVEGVVIIPRDLLTKVVELCKLNTRIDEQCMQAIQNGTPLWQAFKQFRGK